SERIADMQNRAQNAVYKQSPDSVEFYLSRSKLIAGQGQPREAVAHFTQVVREHRYADEASAHYGLASALARARDYPKAMSEVDAARKLLGPHPMVELLAARILVAQGNAAGAKQILHAALARTPNYRPLHYAYIETLQTMGEHQA